MRSVGTPFPWLCQLGCGCQFTRIELTNQPTYRHWDPCGTHLVLAATGHQPEWPPTVAALEREPALV